MTTLKARTSHRITRPMTRNLPRNVTKQLERIYNQSIKNIKKHPYTATSTVLLTIGMGCATYFLIRYLKG